MAARSVIFNIIGRDEASPAFLKAATSAETASARIARAGDKMISAGRKLTHSVTLPILAVGAASVKMATDFNSAMTRVQTQAGASARDVRILSKEVLALAKYAQQGPVELADSLYHLKSVGMGNVQAMKALRYAADFAAVGHANLEETTNALAGAWRTGIKGAKDMHQAVRTLNAVIGAGNMSMEDLNLALGTGILPTAKTFGLTLKDVGSALALFTDEGVPADAAATRLRMSMSLLGAPSKAAEKQLKKIGLTGLTLANDMRKPNGLIVAIGDLKDHLEDPKFHLSLSRQAQLLSHAFGGGRSSSAILSMINNFDVLEKKQDQVTRSLRKYDHAVKVQRATPEAKFKLLESSLQRSLVMIGTDLIPIATDLARGFGDVAESFNGLTDGSRKLVIEGALALAALGPLLSIGGRLVKLFALTWRVGTAPASFFTKTAAARVSMTGVGTSARTTATAMTATGTAAQTAATKAEVAALKVKASQLSEQAAVERAAAGFAVAEDNKARAAVVAAESIATAARAAGGAEAVLAERAASDARLFAQAKAAEADAAVRSASVITSASYQTTRALGRQQALMAPIVRQSRLRGAGMGLGLGFGIGGQFLGPAIAGNARRGTARNALGTLTSDAATGALIGSMFGPEGALIGAGVGTVWGGVNQIRQGGETVRGRGSVASVSALGRRYKLPTHQALVFDEEPGALGGVVRATGAPAPYHTVTKGSKIGRVLGDTLAVAKKGSDAFARSFLQTGGVVTKVQQRMAITQSGMTGLYYAMTKAGLGAKDVRDALTGTPQRFDRILAAWQRTGQASPQLVAALKIARQEMVQGRRAATDMAIAQGRTLKSFMRTGTMADLLTGKLEDLNKAHQTAGQRARQFHQAEDDLSHSVRLNGRSLAGNTIFGRNNAHALKAAAVQALAHAQAVYDQTGSLKKARHALIADRDALLKHAAQLHLNKDRARELVGQLLKIKPIHAKVTVDTATAKADLNSVITKMIRIGQGASAVINITTVNGRTGARNTVKAQAVGTMAAFGQKTIPPNTAFTVGEGGWEGGVTDAQGRASIFPKSQALAMGFSAPRAFANGTNPGRAPSSHGGPMRITGELRISADSQGNLRAWIEDAALSAVDGTDTIERLHHR